MNNSRENSKNSKTSIFLMEIIIAILIFIVCGAVCVKMFVNAYTLNKSTEELNKAVVYTENIAELYRYYDGDLKSVISHYDKIETGNINKIYYDREYEICDKTIAAYVLTFEQKDKMIDSINISELHIAFTDINQNEIFSLVVEK